MSNVCAGEVEEDTCAGAVQYLVDEGRFVIRLRKRHAGEHFAGLELLGRLLAPPRPSHTSASLLRPSPHIECVTASGDAAGGGDEDREQSRDVELAAALEERLHIEDFDWFIEQTPATPAPAPAPAPADHRARQLHSSLTHSPKSTALDEQPSRSPRSSSGTRVEARAGAGESGDGDDGPPVDVERVERTVSLLLQPPQYGFALRPRSRLLGALSSELRELIELPDPDEVYCIFSMQLHYFSVPLSIFLYSIAN